MSIYICVSCKRLHDTKAGKKNCDHKEVEVKKSSKKSSKTLLPEAVIDSVKANILIRNLSTIGADDVRALAKYLIIEYTNKEETISAIKAKLGK